MKKNNKTYSYHTFIYPFLYDDNGMLTMSEFCEFFEKENSKWKKDDVICVNDEGIFELQKSDVADPLQRRLNYALFQYFNNATRKALFGADGKIVRCFRYDICKETSKYVIETKHNNTNIKLSLDINDIRLKIFNTGVAVIAFELEYSPDNDSVFFKADENIGGKSFWLKNNDAIKIINEYGRRLYPEFLPSEKGDFILCAESIELDLGLNENNPKDNFRMLAEEYLNNTADNTLIDKPVRIPNIVKKLLESCEDEEVFTSVKEKSQTKKFYIEPAIDDRMFVCCCIRDQDYTNSFINTSSCQKAEWSFQTNWNKAKELYAVVNIDGDDSSCQNRKMLDEYFNEQLYLRWIEYGTIHAVTNHSMVCLTGSEVDMAVVYPFLTTYVQMAILTVVQRASLISFEAKITNSIKFTEADVNVQKFQELSHRFALFQGQLMISEVTSQIQGIELYEKLQKMLFIDKLESNVKEQLENLYKTAENEQAIRKAKVDDFISIAGVALGVYSVFSAAMTIYSLIQTKEAVTFVVFLVSFLIAAGLVALVSVGIMMFYKFSLKNKLRKKHEKTILHRR